MKKNNYLFFMLFYVVQLTFSQNEKLVHGKILSQNNPALGIQVLNLVTEKSTISNAYGEFSILAKAEDMLVFISVNYDYKRKFLDQSDIDNGNLMIDLIKKPEQLDEVVVSKSKIDAVNLGIVSANQKTYTPAERKLYTAKSGVLDPLINLISGRTAMLKKEIVVEKNEIALAKVSNLFEDEYYTKKLKIDSDLIKSFQYFMIEDNDFAKALKSKNKTMMKFIMSKLAVNFNQLQANEKK
jgi:hypothetical protein